jgi:hypothetical protein
MGAVKPGYGPREPKEYGSSPTYNDDLSLVLQEKREMCKECSLDNGVVCCGKYGNNSRCQLFNKLCTARAAGLSNDRFVRPKEERVLYQDVLVDPCERCSMLYVKCLGKKLTQEEVDDFEANRCF